LLFKKESESDNMLTIETNELKSNLKDIKDKIDKLKVSKLNKVIFYQKKIKILLPSLSSK